MPHFSKNHVALSCLSFNTDYICMMPVVASGTEIGYIEKAIDIYSRRGAENAKEDEYNDAVFAEKHMSPLRSLRLSEKTGCKTSS